MKLSSAAVSLLNRIDKNPGGHLNGANPNLTATLRRHGLIQEVGKLNEDTPLAKRCYTLTDAGKTALKTGERPSAAA